VVDSYLVYRSAILLFFKAVRRILLAVLQPTSRKRHDQEGEVKIRALLDRIPLPSRQEWLGLLTIWQSHALAC